MRGPIQRTKPPYQIPPFSLPSLATLRKLDPWYLCEFFRIEALLRSEKVWELYQQRGQPDFLPDNLTNEYAVEDGWGILEGQHHKYLAPNGGQRPLGAWDLSPGIENLKEVVSTFYNVDPAFLGTAISEMAGDQRFLFLRLDCAFPPEVLIASLRKILKQQYKLTNVSIPSPVILENGMTGEYAGTEPSWHPGKRPPLRDWTAWAQYLQCYDLRKYKGLYFGQIAVRVYGDNRKRENAERAYERTSDLIRSAQDHSWPSFRRPR